jgi:uncharacterized protein
VVSGPRRLSRARAAGLRAAGLPAIVLACLLAGVGAGWGAVGAGKPPPPTRWVTDNAGLLSPQARQQLDAALEDYQRRTGHQVLVWIGDSTGVVPIEDFANAAFQAWRVGRKGIDDGLALFVMAKDRKLRFEVGYGLEGRLPDVVASRIIREIMTPRLQAGDADGAITAGVAAAIAAVDGRDWRGAGGTAPGGGAAGTGAETGSEGGQVPRAAGGRSGRVAHPLSLPQMILFGILGLGVLFLLITHPSLALWLLFNVLSGGRGGDGGGGGGGGFGGGGGRSGGGGASGSW